MLPVLIIALVLAGTALALAARAVLLPRIRTDENLERIGAYGYAGEAAITGPERITIRGPPWRASSGALLFRQLGRGAPGGIRSLLLAAGVWDTKPATIVGYRVLSATAAGGVVAWLSSAAIPMPLALLGGPVRRARGLDASRLPAQVPREAAARAHRARAARADRSARGDPRGGPWAERSTPAGGERMEGPLADELRLTLREQNLGLSLDRALRNMLERCRRPRGPGFRPFSRPRGGPRDLARPDHARYSRGHANPAPSEHSRRRPTRRRSNPLPAPVPDSPAIFVSSCCSRASTASCKH